MEFIIENYLIFVLIGSFLVFALIGYIIDLVRKNNKENNINNNSIPNGVNSIEDISKIVENNNEFSNLVGNENIMDNRNQEVQSVTNINNNIADDLLNSYNDTNNI